MTPKVLQKLRDRAADCDVRDRQTVEQFTTPTRPWPAGAALQPAAPARPLPRAG